MDFRIPEDRDSRPKVREVLCFLRARRRFLLTTHVRVDGDALGSEIALARLLRQLGKTVRIVNEEPVPRELAFLPGAAAAGAGPSDLDGRFDAAIVVDSGSYPAGTGLRPFLPADLPLVNIDHHASNNRFGALNWVDPAMGSVGEMVYRLVRGAGCRLDREMAFGLYVSMVTDTGRFSFSNTSPYCHLIAADLLRRGIDPGQVTQQLYGNKSRGDLKLQAACLRGLRLARGGRLAWFAMGRDLFRRCGAHPRDSQEFVEILKSMRGVRVALLFREVAEGGRTRVKVSIRTEPGYDASRLARTFGGGGHRRAAGCTCDGALAAVARRILARARRAPAEWWTPD